MLALEKSWCTIRIIPDLRQRPLKHGNSRLCQARIGRTLVRLHQKFRFVCIITHADMCISLACIQAKRQHLALLIWTTRFFTCEWWGVLNGGWLQDDEICKALWGCRLTSVRDKSLSNFFFFNVSGKGILASTDYIFFKKSLFYKFLLSLFLTNHKFI